MKDDDLEKIKLAIIPGVKKEPTSPKNRNRKTSGKVYNHKRGTVPWT